MFYSKNIVAYFIFECGEEEKKKQKGVYKVFLHF
jgi:hypothetical protein